VKIPHGVWPLSPQMPDPRTEAVFGLWLSSKSCHSSAVLARESAQRRADRIRAFQDELAAARADGALVLTPAQDASLREYHGGLLAQLARTYDVDRSDAQHQLSLGMRVVSLLGAAALTGAVVLFFLDVWGALPSAGQIAIAWAAPVIALAGAVYAARIERTRYFTAMLSFLALGCFIMNVAVLGTVLNSVPSSTPLLIWAAFALILAYEWDLGWMLAAGAAGILAYFATAMVSLVGFPLDIALQRPELLFVPAAAVYSASLLRVNQARGAFPVILRRVGLIVLLLAVIVLGEAGGMSFLPLSNQSVRAFYQVVGAVLAALAIWIGMRKGWRETLNIGAIAMAVLLFLRYIDWWWDWMPTYLFFLIVAVTAIASLVILRRLRARMGTVA
jgi:hypothetical protein